MLKRYSRIPIDNPRQVIVAVSLLTLLVSPFILKVEFATDVEAFLPQSEEVQTYDTINADFGQDSSVVYLYYLLFLFVIFYSLNQNSMGLHF